MQRIVAAFGAGLAVLACGCGDDGNGMPPVDGIGASINGVVPHVGRPGRSYDVSVAVDGTLLDPSSSIDFGSGVTVTSSVVVTSTVMSLELAIADDAALGPRDVTITTPGATLVGTAAFEIDPHLEVVVQGGDVVQGGQLLLDVTNHDERALEEPYLFERGVWALLPPHRASATHWSGYVLVDPVAPESMAIGMVNTTYAWEPREHFRSDALAVTRREPESIAMPANMQVSRTGQVFDAPLTTRVYKLSTTGSGIISFRAEGDLSPAIPIASVLPTSGSFGDVLATTYNGTYPFPVPAGAHDLYVVVRERDNEGSPAHLFDVRAFFRTSPIVAEQSTPHSSPSAAQPLTFTNAVALVEGSLDPADGSVDQPPTDMYRVAAASTTTLQVALRTDADLEVTLVGTSGPPLFQIPTNRPLLRVAGRLATVPAGTYFVIVRPREGLHGRPTGSYLLSVSTQ